MHLTEVSDYKDPSTMSRSGEIPLAPGGDAPNAGELSDVGVILRVWGWDDAILQKKADLLDSVIDTTASCVLSGMATNDIADHLLFAFAGLFEDADVSDGSSVGEFEVTLVPYVRRASDFVR